MDNITVMQPAAGGIKEKESIAPETMSPAIQPIGSEQVKNFTRVLQKYKGGKTQTEQRVIQSENWWKLRNSTEEKKNTMIGADGGFISKSGWLHNVIVSKHADAIEAYPEPNILPREDGDRAEARILSAIIPCILEQNDFEQTYSDVMWQKLKAGTGVYKVVWDAGKLHGLGDICIERVNLLNVYWEPTVTDIQKSRYLFQAETYDKDILEEMYPQLAGKLKGDSTFNQRFQYDDTDTNENKATVVEVYYHKTVQGKRTLQYCKYAGEEVIYATENDAEMAVRGLYDHCLYPYVFDPLYPIEGSPCGYGFVDICRNPQTELDLMKTAFVKNAMVGSVPRYFVRGDGAINEEEFSDLSKHLVHVSGTLGEDSLRPVETNNLDSVYVSLFDRTIQELRETSGNTETSTGNVSSGVTAASAIAALQEASGKGSRDSTKSSYRAYGEIVKFCIELIRQFYDMPRKFRIVGQYGMEQYITYSNAYLQPQHQGNDFGMDMGYRLPVFDIKVSAQKQSVYTKVTQNELALQFFQMGFFNPQMADQALMCLDLMEFDGKDTVMQKVAQQGTMFQKLIQYMQLALTLAMKAAPEMVPGLSNDVMQAMGGASPTAGVSSQIFQSDSIKGIGGKENSMVTNARVQSSGASQPDGGSVTKRGEKR